jgi:hypothetical protein
MQRRIITILAVTSLLFASLAAVAHAGGGEGRVFMKRTEAINKAKRVFVSAVVQGYFSDAWDLVRIELPEPQWKLEDRGFVVTVAAEVSVRGVAGTHSESSEEGSRSHGDVEKYKCVGHVIFTDSEPWHPGPGKVVLLDGKTTFCEPAPAPEE